MTWQYEIQQKAERLIKHAYVQKAPAYMLDLGTLNGMMSPAPKKFHPEKIQICLWWAVILGFGLFDASAMYRSEYC